MDTVDSSSNSKTKLSIVVGASLIAVAAAIAWLIFNTEPKAQREGASKKTPMLVDTITVNRGRYQPLIVAMGEVIPEHQIALRAQVSGRIIQKAEVFAPGVFVDQGTTLLAIERKDFELGVQQSLSDLLNAQALMAIERGEQSAAKAEFGQLKRKLSAENEALVLREPELKIATARLRAMEAAHEQAKLDLKRSEITAPFNAQVVEQLAGVGTLVNDGDSLGRLVGTDRYWVEVQLPLAALSRIDLPATTKVSSEESEAKLARVRDRLAWPKDIYREAKVHAAVGELDRQTRMARLLLAVDDPLSLTEANQQAPKLMPGAYVEAQISATALEQVVRLPREYLRQNNTAWVMADRKLQIRDLDIAYQDPNYAYVSAGLEDGDEIVVTTLSRVREGAELRLSSDTSNAEVDSANVESSE